MQTRPGPLGCLAWLTLAHLLLSGCSGGDVWLGGVDELLELDGCVGENTVCDADVAAETLVTSEPKTCDGPLLPGVQIDVFRELWGDYCGNICSATVLDLKLAPDGTLWLLGETGEYKGALATIWIRRYDANGHLLSGHDLSDSVRFDRDKRAREADIAFDARSHAFVVLYEGDLFEVDAHTRSWLIELDEHGEPASPPIAIGGLGGPRIALASETDVLIAGNAPTAERRGTLLRLNAEQQRVWAQTDVRTSGFDFGGTRVQGPLGRGVIGLAVDAAYSTVLAEHAAPNGHSDLGLMRFDPHGNLLWDRRLDTRFVGNSAHPVIAAANGGVLVSGQLVQSGSIFDASVEWLGHVSADGKSSWVYEFNHSGGVHVASRNDTGETYVSVDSGVGTDYLAIISADGEQCRRYALPTERQGPFGTAAAQLDLDATGKIYALTEHLGRFRLPNE